MGDSAREVLKQFWSTYKRAIHKGLNIWELVDFTPLTHIPYINHTSAMNMSDIHLAIIKVGLIPFYIDSIDTLVIMNKRFNELKKHPGFIQNIQKVVKKMLEGVSNV